MQQFAQKSILYKTPTCLAVRTLGDAVLSSQSVVSLDNNEQTDAMDAYTLADLPMRMPKCSDEILSKWPNVRNVSVVVWEVNRVDLPVDCDVPGTR